MLESGLRFAFAFLPAGVAVVVGLVLAIQRRRVQPDVATPAMWGLGLQLVAIIAGALVNVIPSSIVQSGGDASTALTVATVIALVVAALTVVSWVLILTALFRRLPSAAGADAPTTAVPTPPPGFMPEPFADDAPTGRHALLDEHGQQVVAQPGVRLSPQTAGLAAGAVGAAGLGAAAAASGSDASVPEHTADLPTEAVPIVGGRATSGDSNASLLASSDRESGSVDQPDPGPAGVDESAVGGTPTGAEPDDAAAPSSTGQVVPPPAPVAAADPGPAGVDEAAVGGTPTGPDRSADGEHDTDLTPVPDSEVVGVAAEVDVDEAAVGGTPTTADADPGTPSPAPQAGADRTSSSGPIPAAAPVRPTPRPQPSAPFAAAGTSPEQSGAAPSAPFADAGSSPERSGAAPSAPFAAAASAERSDGGPSSPAQSSAPFPAVSGASTEQAVAPSSTSSPASSSPGSSSPASGPQPAVAPSADAAASGPQPAARPHSGPQPAVAPSADAAASGPQPAARPHSGPQPSATSSSFAAPMPAAPRSQPATPPADASAGSGSPSSQAAAPTSAARNGGHGSDHEEPADPPSGSTPASHPGLAGAMRSPRPAPSPGGSDLFTPSAPIPEVAEEAVGGTPAEPQEARRSTRAPVAGWFEPVTDGTAEGFGTENRDN